MKEWRDNYEKNLKIRLATINDDRLVTQNGVFYKENGKIYKKPINDFSGTNKIEITMSDYQKEINSFNKLRQQREDNLNNCIQVKNQKVAFKI